MPGYDPHATVRSARSEYFQRSGFAADGGYGDRWVTLKIGRGGIRFPNTAARVRAVKLHDIHHLLTEYDTTWLGEAEIAAWEIASGCARHYAAWLLNLGAFAIGLLIGPKLVFHAFVRGRKSRNLYRTEFHEALLDRTVGDLRKELGISENAERARGADIATFTLWAVTAVTIAVLPYAAVAAAVVILTRWWGVR